MALAKLDTRTALSIEPNTNDLVFIHRPSGLSYKMTWEVFKGLIEGYIAEGEYLDFGGANQVSATELKTIVDGDVTFINTTDGFTVTNQPTTIATQNVPQSVNETTDSGYTYTAGVQDLSNLAQPIQAILGAINLSNFTGFTVQATSSNVELKAQVTGTRTAGISIEDAKIKLLTPEQISLNVTNGAILRVVDAATGEVEFIETQWTTVGRPSSPTTEHDGFNTTLLQREYWDGSAWQQY